MSIPIAPTIVQTKAGNTSAWISWEDNNDFPVSYYKIVSYPDSQIVYTRNLSTHVYNLRNNTTYYFYVHAINPFGESLRSNLSDPVRPFKQTKPSPPTIVETKAGNASAYVAWTAPTDPNGYPISYYKVVSFPDFQVVYTENLSTRIYSLRNNVVYRFYVYAVNSMGESLSSNESNPVRPFRKSRPDAPLHVIAEAGNASAVVSWNAPKELMEDAPIMYYKVISYPDLQVVYTENLSTRLYSLRKNVAYHFYVYAANIFGESPAGESNPIVPYIVSRPDPPIHVGINLKTVGNKLSLTVVWSPPLNDGRSPITQYKVIHIPTNTMTITSETSLTFLEDVLISDVYTHNFVVFATNSLGDSKVSEISLPPLQPPTNASFVIGDRSCALFWDPSPPANEYVLTLLDTTTTATTSDHFYTFHDLQPYVNYTVSIQAKKNNQISQETFVAFTSDAVPETPGNFRKDNYLNLNLTEVVLSWDPAYASDKYPVIYYTLYRFPESVWDNSYTDYVPRVYLDKNENQIILTDLLATVPERFVLTASNELGESLFSESIYVNTYYRPDKTVLYKKLVTGGNNPCLSKRARYSQYIQANSRATHNNNSRGPS